MNEFIEKLNKRLKEKLLEYINKANDEMLENGNTLDFENFLGHKEAYENVLYEIINELAEEYKGGWIPCSERLPEEGQIVLANVRKPNKYVNKGIPIIITEYEDVYYWRNGTILAWQPLPQPYQPEGE